MQTEDRCQPQVRPTLHNILTYTNDFPIVIFKLNNHFSDFFLGLDTAFVCTTLLYFLLRILNMSEETCAKSDGCQKQSARKQHEEIEMFERQVILDEERKQGYIVVQLAISSLCTFSFQSNTQVFFAENKNKQATKAATKSKQEKAKPQKNCFAIEYCHIIKF